MTERLGEIYNLKLMELAGNYVCLARVSSDVKPSKFYALVQNADTTSAKSLVTNMLDVLSMPVDEASKHETTNQHYYGN